ncbi:MAG TPA: DUF6468 domain-containing protein [Acetobacteraceae bacterium]|nr:DUF6468 domain-containing protein [Acetobacteraceae bacterium]
MAQYQWLLDLILALLLGATLIYAARLERALGVLRRDRAALEELVGGFNASFRQAETGIAQLRAAADGAGRQVARQVEQGRALQSELQFLADRADRVADRLEQQMRAARPLLQEPPPRAETAEPRVRSQAERDLLAALRMAR